MRAFVFFAVFAVFAAASFASCATTSSPKSSSSERDPHSFARPDEARVTHVSLDVAPDFDRGVIVGRAALSVVRVDEAADVVVVDDRDLVIEDVVDGAGHALAWSVGTVDAVRGAPLSISLPAGKAGDVVTIAIRYQTKKTAQALQWLTAPQTASQKLPFLFTQGESILTRTWIPLQDSPGIRFTWDARVTVPAAMRAVMGAEHVDEGVTSADGASRVFSFRMKEPIPAYLVALAVGDIAFRPLGDRCGVYADPTVVDAAAFEFADTEKMVQTAESLYGAYRWGRYDILVLPPSFPFGGMENPRLTFASPTVLAGDRSLVSLVAHELAHSWSGNLVTNATWADIWLNEGFTVYFEDRIVEALYGADVNVMGQVLSMQDLDDELAHVEGSAAERDDHARLYRPLDGEDPDDGLTGVPYIKGAAFLRSLESVVGRARFDAFLRSYFDAHAFQSMTTARFLDLVKRDLAQGDEATTMQLDAWAYGAAFPSSFARPTSSLLARVDADVARLNGGGAPADLALNDYSALMRVHLLKNLSRAQSPAQMQALDAALGLSATGNTEVLFEWLRLVVENHFEPALPQLERHLTRVGRLRLVMPLYEQLATTTWGREFAMRVFAQAKPNWHPLTISAVDEILRPR